MEKPGIAGLLSTMHVIIEAERGCALPDDTQLAKYASTVTRGPTGALLIAAGGSPAFAAGRQNARTKKARPEPGFRECPRKESNLQPSD